MHEQKIKGTKTKQTKKKKGLIIRLGVSINQAVPGCVTYGLGSKAQEKLV